MIDVQCKCGNALKISEQMVGQVVVCPNCRRKVHLVSGEALADGAGAGDFDSSLIVAKGPVMGGEEFLLGGVLEIGMGKLENNPIRLPGTMVSRAHAKLVRLDFGPSRWKVVDTGSRNGVFVNGQKVAEAELNDGDLVRIGEFEFEYRNTFAPVVETAAPPALETPTEATGPERVQCPSCGKKLKSKAKICVACGINVRSGRPVVMSHGVDEDALQVYAEQMITVASFVVPVTPMPMPIASEAYGSSKPWTIRIIAIATVLASIAFFIYSSQKGEPGSELLLWPPQQQQARQIDPKTLPPQALDAAADQLEKKAPDEFQEYMDDVRDSVPETEVRREAARRILLEYLGRPQGEFHWWQLFSHAMLHDNSWWLGLILHLGGNLLFLMVFGTRVNALLGNVATAIIYPILAAAAAAGYLWMGHPTHPMLGASGAINGLAGMYLILYPVNRVYCAMWIRIRWRVYIKIFPLRGFWVLLLYFAYDSAMIALGWGGSTAHTAHVGGFLAGVIIALGLLCSRQFDCRSDLLSVMLGKYAWPLVGKPSRWNAPTPTPAPALTGQPA